MLTYWRAGAGALRGPLVVGLCLLCFVTGSLMAPPSDTPTPPASTQPTAAVTDESVRALAEALEHASTSTPPVTGAAADEAAEVLDAIRSGQIHVTPAPASTTTTTTGPPSTTTPPASTTTTTVRDERPLLDWPPVPSTVPPPFTEVVP